MVPSLPERAQPLLDSAVPTSLPAADKKIRVIGFDDAPFQKGASSVSVGGVVCADTRFEGMVWGRAQRDGFDATFVLAEMLLTSKYHPQVHAVLLDGIAVGGLNIIDLPELAERVELPCIAVMRKMPDLAAMKAVIAALPSPARRLALLGRAGTIHQRPPFFFQVAGGSLEDATRVLDQATDTGHVPEALRLAHLIGSAIELGESRGRA